MMEDPKYRVEGLSLPKGDCIRDQTFADDTAVYLRGAQSNIDITQNVLKLFCKASGAKINWNKSAAIWVNKREKTWVWGREVGLKWILEGEGVRYLGVHVATLTWPSVGVKPNTWKSWGFGVLRDSRMFRARQQGPKHLSLGCSWCHWKGLEA
jgi:hypothetical protein